MTDVTGNPHPSGDRTLLLQAALDGELDAAAMLLFEKQLTEDPALNAEYRRLTALRQVVRKLPKIQASDTFRARMAAIATEPQKPAARPRKTWFGEWRSSALAASFALILGSGLTFLLLQPEGPDVTQELIAGHVRGMISGQPSDVATSDRHTVKPWFATRITEAPQVYDLKADGFALDGGRVDVVDGKPVATLVFRHLKHVISVSELPGSPAHLGLTEGHRTVKGYSTYTWSLGDAPDNKTTYVAVSDIAPGELDNLAAAFRKAVTAEQ
jgi:anti-sigma factor RsiW